MAKNLGTIEEFDNLIDLPGGCNILAAGKNTPIWKPLTQSNIAKYYQAQSQQLNAFLQPQDTLANINEPAVYHLF